MMLASRAAEVALRLFFVRETGLHFLRARYHRNMNFPRESQSHKKRVVFVPIVRAGIYCSTDVDGEERVHHE